MARGEPSLTLILGGARSGKSDYAEALASSLGERVLYVATAEVLDEEMQTRVMAHQARRPSTWDTLEAPLGVGRALESYPSASHARVILLDCLTLLVSNVLLSGGPDAPEADPETAWAWVRAEIDSLIQVWRTMSSAGGAGPSAPHLIVVSNEVGLGIVPPYSLGRTYRDCLGWANQALAREADQVILMVAGLPIDAKALPMVWPEHSLRGQRA